VSLQDVARTARTALKLSLAVVVGAALVGFGGWQLFGAIRRADREASWALVLNAAAAGPGDVLVYNGIRLRAPSHEAIGALSGIVGRNIFGREMDDRGVIRVTGIVGEFSYGGTSGIDPCRWARNPQTTQIQLSVVDVGGGGRAVAEIDVEVGYSRQDVTLADIIGAAAARYGTPSWSPSNHHQPPPNRRGLNAPVEQLIYFFGRERREGTGVYMQLCMREADAISPTPGAAVPYFRLRIYDTAMLKAAEERVLARRPPPPPPPTPPTVRF
jgi:hypothetical protein